MKNFNFNKNKLDEAFNFNEIENTDNTDIISTQRDLIYKTGLLHYITQITGDSVNIDFKTGLILRNNEDTQINLIINDSEINLAMSYFLINKNRNLRLLNIIINYYSKAQIKIDTLAFYLNHNDIQPFLMFDNVKNLQFFITKLPKIMFHKSKELENCISFGCMVKTYEEFDTAVDLILNNAKNNYTVGAIIPFVLDNINYNSVTPFSNNNLIFSAKRILEGEGHIEYLKKRHIPLKSAKFIQQRAKLDQHELNALTNETDLPGLYLTYSILELLVHPQGNILVVNNLYNVYNNSGNLLNYYNLNTLWCTAIIKILLNLHFNAKDIAAMILYVDQALHEKIEN